MAEAVLTDIAASIIKSLGSFALQEIGLLCGFKDELKKLGKTVSTIQAVLLDAEEKQANNHAVKDWLGKLKDAMFEADDLLDDYSTELLRRQVMTRDKKAKQAHIFFSKSNQLVYGFKMGQRVNKVRKTLDEIADDRRKFGFTERPPGTQSEHRKREDTHSFVPEEKVIGRGDAKNAVKKLLMDSDVKENVSIIPIVGIGGQGKTTLARYVYNDEEVQRHFELRLWACVSDPFDVKDIVAKLIASATQKTPGSLEIDPLQSQLRAEINGKRYLLVLDDVWSENRGTWLEFETLLSGGLKGSKVLITTRSKKVAEITGTVSPYLLQTLRLHRCRELKELPEDTRNLISLRHLLLDGCASLTHMPHGLGVLTALQTLTRYTLGKNESSVPKRKGGLDELDSLDELRGELLIKGLEHLRSSPLEAKAANYLERKQYLRSLELHWDPEAGDNSDKAIVNDEQLLENLRPHLNLRSLDIYGYAGVGLSSWVSSLSNLVDITLRNCKWCQHIPSLDRLPSLKFLSLENLSVLEYISNDGSDVSSSSLEDLRLRDLPKLRGWRRMRETVTAEHHHLPLFPSFPSLSYLSIRGCPMMSLIPVVASGSQTTPPSSSPFSDLSKLKDLELQGLEELEYLPEELLQNLTSLENLEIKECRKLQISMSPLFQHLTALEDLRISTTLISNEDEDGAQCLGPTILCRLYIKNVTSLVSLPRELRHAPTLQCLEIENCPSLVSLPEWIAELTSLQTLRILKCPNLLSLPEGMGRLTTLRCLTIAECPPLEERCKRGTGEDWPKIAHVPAFSNWRF